MIRAEMMERMSAEEFTEWIAVAYIDKQDRPQHQAGAPKENAQQSPDQIVAALKAFSKNVPPKAHRAKQ